MKFRSGFVSNSSTSSFCIYGAVVDEHDLLDFRIVIAATKRILNEDKTLKTKEDCLDYFGISEVMSGALEGTGLVCKQPDGEGEVYIGKPWNRIRDNQTGAEFKAEVSKELERVLGKNFECHHHQHSWKG